MTSSQIPLPMLPGFSEQQVHSMTAYFQYMLHTTFEQYFGPLPPQPTQPPKLEQEQQAIAEDFTEKITEKKSRVSSSRATSINNTSQLSKIPAQATMQVCREHAVRLSNTPFLVSQHARLLDFQHTSFLASQLASPPGYIRHAKDMEATGQG